MPRTRSNHSLAEPGGQLLGVQNAAHRAIEQAEVIRLSLVDQECFALALLSPPKPSPALERAFTRRNKLLRAE